MIHYTLAMAAGTAIPFPIHAPLDDFPQVRSYLVRLEPRPAWQRAPADRGCGHDAAHYGVDVDQAIHARELRALAGERVGVAALLGRP